MRKLEGFKEANSSEKKLSCLDQNANSLLPAALPSALRTVAGMAHRLGCLILTSFQLHDACPVITHVGEQMCH